MEKGLSFDQALKKVHTSFGNSLKRLWNTHTEYSIFANGSGYKNFVRTKIMQINRKYRRNLWCEIKRTITTPKYLFFLLLFSFINYYVIFYAGESVMKAFVASVIFLPMLAPYYYSIKMWFKTKRTKSINLEYALFYAGISLIFFNLIFRILRPQGMFHLLNEYQFKWTLIFTIPLCVILNYAGFIVYKKAYNYYDNLHKKLKTL